MVEQKEQISDVSEFIIDDETWWLLSRLRWSIVKGELLQEDYDYLEKLIKLDKQKEMCYNTNHGVKH